MTPHRSVSHGYQLAELGLIPAEWSICSIGELFGFLRTASNSRADLDNTGDIAYVHYGDIHTRFNHFIDFTCDDVPRLSAEIRVTATLLSNGDLIVADASEDEAGVGKSVEIRNLGSTRAVSGLHTLLLRPKGQRISEGYRGYLLEQASVKEQLRCLATGLKVFGISKGVLKSVLVSLPPLSEQSAITEALSDMDDLLGMLEALIAKKRAITQAAMQQLLTGKIRLPGFEGEWKSNRLGDQFSIRVASSKAQFIDEGGKYLVVDMGAITADGKLVSTKRTDYDYDFLTEGELVMPKDDIGGGNIIGKVGYIDTDGLYVLGDHVYALSATCGCPKFFSYVINYHETNSALRKKVGGSAQLGLARKDVEDQVVPVPDIEEQEDIARVLSDMDAEIATLKRRRDKVRAVKQGMMEQLLNGRVRLV